MDDVVFVLQLNKITTLVLKHVLHTLTHKEEHEIQTRMIHHVFLDTNACRHIVSTMNVTQCNELF